MNRLRTVLFEVRPAVLICLIWRVGPRAIASSLAHVTVMQLALVCLAHGLAMVVDTLGWRYAFPRDTVPFGTLFAARTAGEAVNLLTALGSVGGEAVKAWLVRDRVAYAESVPSVIAAKAAGMVGQALFLVLGLVAASGTLMWHSPIGAAMPWVFGIELLAVAGFVAVQICGVIGRLGRLLSAVGFDRAETHVAHLDEALRRYYRNHWRRFLASTAFHVLGCVMSVVETALIIAFLGVSTSLVMATAVDAVGWAVRFATFFVPGSVGVIESANAAAFAALGFSASAGLGFSFVRRARQVVWIGLGIAILAVMRARRRAPDESADPSSARALARRS